MAPTHRVTSITTLKNTFIKRIKQKHPWRLNKKKNSLPPAHRRLRNLASHENTPRKRGWQELGDANDWLGKYQPIYKKKGEAASFTSDF